MADFHHGPANAKQCGERSIICDRNPSRAVLVADQARTEHKGPNQRDSNAPEQMPYLSVTVLSADVLGERFVTAVADERGGNRVRDLRREKNITGTGGGNFDDFVEEYDEIGEPSLNAKIVKYMSYSVADLLFQCSSFFSMNELFFRRFPASAYPHHFGFSLLCSL